MVDSIKIEQEDLVTVSGCSCYHFHDILRVNILRQLRSIITNDYLAVRWAPYGTSNENLRMYLLNSSKV